jgi:hypothetical protein
LGELDDCRAVEPLAKTVLYDTNADFRENALHSLVKLKPVGQDKIEKLFTNSLNNSSGLVRCRAVYSLQTAGLEQAIPILIKRVINITYGPGPRSYVEFINIFPYIRNYDIPMVTPGQVMPNPQTGSNDLFLIE